LRGSWINTKENPSGSGKEYSTAGSIRTRKKAKYNYKAAKKTDFFESIIKIPVPFRRIRA